MERLIKKWEGATPDGLPWVVAMYEVQVEEFDENGFLNAVPGVGKLRRVCGRFDSHEYFPLETQKHCINDHIPGLAARVYLTDCEPDLTENIPVWRYGFVVVGAFDVSGLGKPTYDAQAKQAAT